MNKILCGMLFLGIFLQSCGKKKDHFAISAELKKHFLFLPGTYWVYRDSITGEEDSFYVTSNYFGTYENEDATSDYINIYINEYSPAHMDSINWGLYLVNTSGITSDWKSKKSKQVGLFQGYSFDKYPFNGFPVLTTYSLNGNNFINVALINQRYTLSYPTSYSYSDLFYVNDSVWIIKMSLNHPQDSLERVWELERWKIVK